MEAWKIRKVNQWIFRCSGAVCPDKREPLVSLFTITYSQILSDHIFPAWRYPLMDHGDDVYHAGIVYDTVKDGCISPEGDDIMGQMMLALRFGNAQKI